MYFPCFLIQLSIPSCLCSTHVVFAFFSHAHGRVQMHWCPCDDSSPHAALILFKFDCGACNHLGFQASLVRIFLRTDWSTFSDFSRRSYAVCTMSAADSIGSLFSFNWSFISSRKTNREPSQDFFCFHLRRCFTLSYFSIVFLSSLALAIDCILLDWSFAYIHESFVSIEDVEAISISFSFLSEKLSFHPSCCLPLVLWSINVPAISV